MGGSTWCLTPLHYCSNGSFALYDFRCEGERRRTDTLELALDGEVTKAAFKHTLGGGVLLSRAGSFAPPQAFNSVSPGQVDGRPSPNPPPRHVRRKSPTRSDTCTCSPWPRGPVHGLAHTRSAAVMEVEMSWL